MSNKVIISSNNRINLGLYQHIDVTITFEEELPKDKIRLDFAKEIANDVGLALAFAIDKNYKELVNLKQNVKDLPK